MTQTFDNKRMVKPLQLIDIDKAFFNWFDSKLNVSLRNTKGDRQKVPVVFVGAERWHISRQEGIRDKEGTLALPIIVIARTGEGGGNEPGTGRIFADIHQDHVYYKKVDPKSSLIKELNKSRPKNIDPDSTIYEVYTHRAPDHFTLTYSVDVWTATVEDMNEFIQKLGQDLNNKSVKNFVFYSDDGFMFRAFQEDSIEDGSNISDFSGQERVIRRTLSFKVPGYIMPQSDQRRDTFKRYFSQTRMVFKKIESLSRAEFEMMMEKNKK